MTEPDPDLTCGDLPAAEPPAPSRLLALFSDEEAARSGEPPPWLAALSGLALTLWPPAQVRPRRGGGWNLLFPDSATSPLEGWLEGLSPARRRWHAIRAGFLLCASLEQWRDALAAANLEPFVPPLVPAWLAIDPASEAISIDLCAVGGDLTRWDRHEQLPGGVLGTLAPERILGRAVPFERSAPWTVGMLVRGLLDTLHAVDGSPVQRMAGIVAGDWPPPAQLTQPTLPVALTALLDRCTALDPDQRPTLRELATALLRLLGGESPDWLALPLDATLEWLRDRSFDQDLTEIGLLFALRPELATLTVVQDYVLEHHREALLRPLREGAPPSLVHAALLRRLPGLVPELAALLADQGAPMQSRIEVARALGGQRAAPAVQALVRALNDAEPIALAARAALERAPEAPPIAWSQPRLALVPCAVPWDRMEPQEGSSVRTCSKCQHPVVQVDSLDALQELAQHGSCAAFTPRDALPLRLHGGPIFYLRPGEQLLLGSSDEADLLVPDAAPRHAWIGVEQGVLHVVPIEGALRSNGVERREPLFLARPDALLVVQGDPMDERPIQPIPRHRIVQTLQISPGAALHLTPEGAAISHPGTMMPGPNPVPPPAGAIAPIPLHRPPIVPLAGAPMPPPPPRLPRAEPLPPTPPTPVPPTPAEPDGLLARIKRFFGG